ncbi:MAG: metal-dependent hydrolase [Candidatus Bathyarchaeota archaeon]|jgi:membrane-bound metal-dependent hydrolase YbcI (DUF457 family)
MALGYILGKATSRSLNVNLNIPLILVASVISDIDLLIPGLEHRGLTHSLVFIFLAFLPAFLVYRKKVAPYFVAVVQHSIPGDYISGEGIQLLWPLDARWLAMGIGIELVSFANFFFEWSLFLMFIAIMFWTKDVKILFQHHLSNMLLLIPILTVLLPTLLSFPLSVPLELVVPHVIYLALFAFSILIDFRHTISARTTL